MASTDRAHFKSTDRTIRNRKPPTLSLKYTTVAISTVFLHDLEPLLKPQRQRGVIVFSVDVNGMLTAHVKSEKKNRHLEFIT